MPHELVLQLAHAMSPEATSAGGAAGASRPALVLVENLLVGHRAGGGQGAPAQARLRVNEEKPPRRDEEAAGNHKARSAPV